MGTIHAILFLSKTAQKMKFSIKEFLSKCDQISQFPADLVKFTAEILKVKLHFLVQCNLQWKQIKEFKSTDKYKLSQILTLKTLSIK